MYTYQADLLRIIDGDTVDALIDLGFSVRVKVRIRMMGINTPESRTRNKEEKVKGLDSKKRLVELLEANDNKFLMRSTEKGKYGRYLADMFTEVENYPSEHYCNYQDITKSHKLTEKVRLEHVSDSKEYIWINKQLISEGYAVEYFGGKR